MNICVVGTGYVGLVTGAVFADLGNEVVCVDNVAEKIDALRRGRMPIYEPGLEEVVARNVADGRLSFTTDLDAAVRHSVIVFITVGTPPKEGGQTDLSAVEAVARALHRDRSDDATERDHRDVDRAAADIRDHAPHRLVDRDTGADSGEDGLLYHIRILRAGPYRRLDNRAFLGRGHSRGDRDEHRRLERVPTKRFPHEIPEHRLGHAIVRDNAVFHRAVRDDAVGRATDHLLRLGTDREDLILASRAALSTHRDDRGLIDDDALPGDEHEHIGGPEVNSKLGGKK